MLPAPTPPAPVVVWVLIPACNEAAALPDVISELKNAGYRTLVVDDGSRDETATVARTFADRVLSHPINLGQGAALQTGMAWLVKQQVPFVVHFDADGQHRVADIPAMLAPLLADEADITLGSRFMSGGAAIDISKGRKQLLRLARITNGLLTGLWLTDAHNGLRALNLKALSSIRLRHNGMAHASEILLEIRKHELRYREVPVHISYSGYSRLKGQSGWNALQILSDLIFGRIFP